MPETDRAEPHSLDDQEGSLSAFVPRGLVGGALMGLANLVPGISGGTMLLAAGVYPSFIGGIAELTTLRFRPRSLIRRNTTTKKYLWSVLVTPL